MATRSRLVSIQAASSPLSVPRLGRRWGYSYGQRADRSTAARAALRSARFQIRTFARLRFAETSPPQKPSVAPVWAALPPIPAQQGAFGGTSSLQPSQKRKSYIFKPTRV